VDSNWQDRSSYARLDGFVECTVPNSRKAFNAKVYLTQLGNNVSREAIHGVWMGFLRLSSSAVSEINVILAEILADPANRKFSIPQLLQELLRRRYPIRVLYTVGHWLDINSLDDVVQAGNF
jgi:phosphoenolpyruvate phosphomutase